MVASLQDPRAAHRLWHTACFAPEGGSLSSTERPCRVLLVDDNPGDARLAEVALATLSSTPPYHTTTVDSLARAVAAVSQQRFDVALLDMGLPDSRGIETVQRFVAVAPGVPVVVLTGIDDDATGLAAISVGAQDYLVKGSLNGPQLHRALSRAMSRKHIESRLRAAEAEQRAILAGSPVGVAVIGCDGTILFSNQRMEHLLGSQPGEITGLPAACLYRDPEEYQSLGAAVARNEAVEGAERELCRRDGGSVWAAVSLRPSLWNDQSAVLMWAYDISGHKKSEESLRADKDHAETLARTRRDLLAILSHEIRTPMAGILGMIGLLLESPLDDSQRDWAETVSYSGQALMAVLDDILDLSKLESGQITLETKPFDLRRTLEGIVSLMSSRAQEKGLRLATRTDKALPRALAGDARRLRQVLLNLLGNAVKFTQQGEILISIDDAGANATGDSLVRFTVTDSGPGIAPALVRQLRDGALSALGQEVGGKGQEVSRLQAGGGLGLSICHRLVALMGGRMGVDSDLGRGSAFWFVLPLATVSSRGMSGLDTSAIPAEPPQAPVSTQDEQPALTVLLVEDNAINQKVICGFLKKGNHTIVLAQDGYEAVEKASRQRFDIVLMDVQMPRMDGLQATQQIRALTKPNRSVPIIALTANVMMEDVQVCLDAGMDAFLAKPVSPAALHDAIYKTIADAAVRRPPVKDSVDTENKNDEGSYVTSLAEKIDFDPVALKGLRGDLGTDYLSSLLGDFISQSQQQLMTIEQARSSVCLEKACLSQPILDARLAAHDLGVTAQNFGLRKLSSAAHRIERCCTLGQAELWSDAYADLVAAFEGSHRLLCHMFPDMTLRRGVSFS